MFVVLDRTSVLPPEFCFHFGRHSGVGDLGFFRLSPSGAPASLYRNDSIYRFLEQVSRVCSLSFSPVRQQHGFIGSFSFSWYFPFEAFSWLPSASPF